MTLALPQPCPGILLSRGQHPARVLLDCLGQMG